MKNILLTLMVFGIVGCATNSETGFQIGFLNIEVSKESEFLWDTVLVEEYDNLNKNTPRAEAMELQTGKKYHLANYAGYDQSKTNWDAKLFCEKIFKTSCVISRVNDKVIYKNLEDYKYKEELRLTKEEERNKWKKEQEEYSRLEKLASSKARIKNEGELKKIIIADLHQRCEDYGFSGESNISACIQREAQHDKELAMQKYELEKTRLALQQAQSRAYAQSLSPVVEEEEDLPFLIKFLGDVAVGVAEGVSDPAFQLHLQQQRQINQLKANQNKDIFRNCRPNC